MYKYIYQRNIGDKTQNTLKYMKMIWIIFFPFLAVFLLRSHHFTFINFELYFRWEIDWLTIKIIAFFKYRLGNNTYEIIFKMKGDFTTLLFI